MVLWQSNLCILGDHNSDCRHRLRKERVRGEWQARWLTVQGGKMWGGVIRGETTTVISKERTEDTENKTFNTYCTHTHDTYTFIRLATSTKSVRPICPEQFGRTEPATFWLKMVSETAFPNLRKVAQYILSILGSTYFSTMNIIKTISYQAYKWAPAHVYENGPDTIPAQI